MYNQHQYIFDMSHSSLLGGNISFAKDSLYKLEYSFNIIERIGTPGIVAGAQRPTVKFKVDDSIVTNISYYFDPSRVGDDSPVNPSSYLDVGPSPYIGDFVVSSTTGGTITSGDVTFKFPLINEVRRPATTSSVSYSTRSEKAVGSIADIRIVNGGGFYTKLPVVSASFRAEKLKELILMNLALNML